MDDREYLEASRQFLADDFHPEKAPPQEVDGMLRAVAVVTAWCDTVKRGLYYGKDITLRSSRGSHTSVKLDPKHAQLIHGIIGLFGEAGELMGHLHDVLTGGSEVDPVNILEELGDMEWYAAVLHRLFSTTPGQARTVNIAKLDKRYPGRRFTSERALERDVVAEREMLEAAAALDRLAGRPQTAGPMNDGSVSPTDESAAGKLRRFFGTTPEPPQPPSAPDPTRTLERLFSPFPEPRQPTSAPKPPEQQQPTPALPPVCSRWRHTNGNHYTVLFIANEMNTDRYPLTVVYQGDNGKIWTRRADDWYRSMTFDPLGGELVIPPPGVIA